MARQLFTASDIRRLRSELKTDVLLLGSADLVTPEAADLAQEYGIRLVREGEPAEKAREPLPSGPLTPLKVVHRTQVIMEPFGQDLASPGMNVRLKDTITSVDGSPMAAGYMSLEQGEFPWTLTYSEIDVVLEGELVITRGSEVVRGGPGDCIMIPEGSSITFGTPSSVRFVYVTYPADWST
jgi:ethanolamine utilization protein EutQ